MMQSCASAAKLRAAGPFFSSALSAMFEYGFPPPRIVNSAVVLKSQRERRMVLSASGKPFQDAGRKTTPSSGSPVVTKRQSAMTSLRASATIIVLRVPIRLSAVRARYHSASALSF
jgi:hypothetical protein